MYLTEKINITNSILLEKKYYTKKQLKKCMLELINFEDNHGNIMLMFECEKKRPAYLIAAKSYNNFYDNLELNVYDNDYRKAFNNLLK